MDNMIRQELERLSHNAAMRREDLLLTGLKKSHMRKMLNIVAGILALLSAGAITSVIADVVGGSVMQLLAALVASISGSLSLVITAYYSDDEILNMLNGASKYLSLRETVHRLTIHPNINNDELFERLSEFQEEYAKLDENYARYFSLQNIDSTGVAKTQMNYVRPKASSSSSRTKTETFKPLSAGDVAPIP